MSILITGATGAYGRRVVIHLLEPALRDERGWAAAGDAVRGV
ncbi:hypothetical protein [Egicoccus halophilus]|nr:hypothetical protein [Egicoccus halophilus]